MYEWLKDRPKQTFLTTADMIGDCWRCCIAAVLNINPEIVPHFADGGDGTWNENCDADTQAWLNARGYVIAHISGNATIAYHAYDDANFDAPLLICSGWSSGNTTNHHAVVYCNGVLMYDPHPDGLPITIEDRWLIFKRPVPLKLPRTISRES